MSNIVDFKRPPKPKEPKKQNPALRKAMTWAGVAAALVAAWAFFHLTGS
ncbi:hypothetical protein NOF55_20965 [Rhizobiaceae bacterium BDR2-2]|uniref:Uncharacterized protein n=1 Tax=Ectorhizobium quercum TaxID=2965071 RepID=A0AAE3N3K4_9HYPH|nr:hypothetical protein [Ectorhizobium quercum]MCX8999581.1 hypothetical protein [Ectorhizobium quercum]